MARAPLRKTGGKPTLPPDQAERVREALARLRERFPSDTALARGMGVSQPTVNQWLSGGSAPSLQQLDAIARHFDVTELEIRRGSEGALEIALSYHGAGRWPQKAVARARDMAARGEERTAQQWAEKLDELAKAHVSK